MFSCPNANLADALECLASILPAWIEPSQYSLDVAAHDKPLPSLPYMSMRFCVTYFPRCFATVPIHEHLSGMRKKAHCLSAATHCGWVQERRAALDVVAAVIAAAVVLQVGL